MWAASKLAGANPEWYTMAVSHATRSAADFFRPDGSTFHVVTYDSGTGEMLKQGTHQGYADNSTWSR